MKNKLIEIERIDTQSIISYQQSKNWLEFKEKWGWSYKYYSLKIEDKLYEFPMQVKNIPVIGKLYLIPKGPNTTSIPEIKKFSNEVVRELQLLDKNAVCLRLEPPIIVNKPYLENSINSTMQFNSTIIIDISNSEDEILANFKSKTRYNINYSYRKNVETELISEFTHEKFETFYNLMKETQAREGFFFRPKKYFFDYWKRLIDTGEATLLLSSINNIVISGLFLIHSNGKGYYKDGGSTLENRNLMAAYQIQWEAIKLLKTKDINSYDLIGSAPSWNKENHPFSGLYQFKSRFSDEITDYIGVLVYPINQNKFKLYKRLFPYFNSLYIRITKNIFF